jgi:flagellar basal-body rod protein FlgG
MITSLKSAASGLIAQRINTDVISNNIANLSTTAYKKSRVNMVDVGQEILAQFQLPGAEYPVDVIAGGGVTAAASQVMFTQGQLRETGNIWDVAIAGRGFFQVALPDGGTAYTRDGSFRIDAQGQLVTSDGFTLDPAITIPLGAENVQIDETGTVSALVDGQSTSLGQLPLAIFPNPEGLISIGRNFFSASESSGQAQVGQPGAEGRGQIMTGVLEGSNVDLAEEMTKLIEAQRAYQLSIKALQTTDEMLGLANNLRR